MDIISGRSFILAAGGGIAGLVSRGVAEKVHSRSRAKRPRGA